VTPENSPKAAEKKDKKKRKKLRKAADKLGISVEELEKQNQQ